MNILFHTPFYIILLCIISAIGISFFVYRYTIPPVSSAKRYILIFLRSIALSLLLLLLCEPLLTMFSTSVVKPSVTILVDNSFSMSLTDATGNREQQLRSLISHSSLKKFSSVADINYYSFSQKVKPLQMDSLLINGTTTDISSALHFIKEKSATNVQSIVLLSDGNYNTGVNPLYQAERSSIPIFTVGIGDSTEQKDIAVQKMFVNSIGYVESKIPVDATIKVSGFANQKLTVSLLEDGKSIAQQTITLSSQNTIIEYPLQFSYVPKKEGTKKLSVRVSSLQNEITEKNNTKSSVIKILKMKMKVVIVAGAPSPDVSAIEQSLQRDNNIESTVFLQKNDGTLFTIQNSQQITNFLQTLSQSDCIILCGYPNNATTNSLQLIADVVKKRSLPIFFVDGRTVNVQKLRTIESLLPFTIIKDKTTEQEVFASIPKKQQEHILNKIESNEFSVWEKLPPIFSSFSIYKTKPEATLLASTKIQNITIQNPLIVARNINNTKSFAVLGYGIYRWKLLASNSQETSDFFNAWISNTIRWLTTREQSQQFRVEPSAETFTQGEPVEFTAQVYNENYQPVENAEVQLTAKSLSTQQQYEMQFSSLGSGRYEGSFENLPEGEYSYKATGLYNNKSIESGEGRFSVGEQSIEFLDTKMNISTLRQIADVSGGKYYSVAEFEKLIDAVSVLQTMKPQEHTAHSEFELWNLSSVLSVIVLIFSVEWFLRKKSGML